MRSCNLISAYQGALALESIEIEVDRKYKTLKNHEIRNLCSFCTEMDSQGCSIADFDGYFVGYSIGQIGKEFDLLRFGRDCIINIEIKSELKVANKMQKILKQMQINYYYLKFLGCPTKIFTYVETDGFYEYDEQSDSVNQVKSCIVAQCMKLHDVDYFIDPDKVFVPSNYLISPFNSTEKFISGEYFLTTAQQKIRREIHSELIDNPFMFFCISANAGTGKTLLMYAIAQEMMECNKVVAIIHCGKLNEGHEKLKTNYGWNIYSIRSIRDDSIDTYLDNCSLLFVDESQRIRESQLKIIIEKSIEKKFPIVFAYDTKQYLRDNESRDISDYLKECYVGVHQSLKKLTTKIRTNKELASFITNLFNIGRSNDHLNYSCITVEYIDNMDDLIRYAEFLKVSGWVTLTFTTSQYNPDPYSSLTCISEKTAHDVIGQEFSKVAFVMDENFRYSDDGKLTARGSYYSASGMLYQIVTRVVDELKVIVLRNPNLYLKLLGVKLMGDN